MSADRPLIPHSRPTVGDGDVAGVAEVVRSGMLAQGRVVDQFESEVASYLERAAGVATNSGTSALHLALLALDVRPDDEVIVPAYTCVALLNAIQHVGARPILAEIDPRDFNLSADAAKAKLTRRTAAIVVPHMFGAPADLDALCALGVPVVEDLAQALGATYKGSPAGSQGTIAVCSFYATKVITTGEGGMLLADDPAILARARDLRDYDGRPTAGMRFNYKMTDFQAALGIQQLRRLPQFLARRKTLAALYDLSFRGLGIEMQAPLPLRGPMHYRYVVRVPDAARAIDGLLVRGIQSKPPVFRALDQYLETDAFPESTRAMREALSIPIYPSLTETEVERILAAVPEVLKEQQEALAWERTPSFSSLRSR